MTYKSVVLTRKGGPEVLEVQELRLPAPHEGEVRVRILYCGVGFTDVIMRLGYYPYAPKIPFTPGYEIVGIIDEVGSNVNGFAKGDKVAALTVYGGYAEYRIVAQEDLVRVPEGIDDAEAVSMILNYITAYQMLHREAQVQKGQHVLFTGASGGVGTSLLQLGREAGLTMYGTASPNKFPLVEQNGGIPIDYKKEDWEKEVLAKSGDGVHAAFDGIGGSFVGKCKACLRPDGKLISYGLTSSIKNGKPDNGTVFAGFMTFGWYKLFMGKRATFYGITKLYRNDKRPFKEDLPKVFELLKQGKIKPVIAEVLPFTEVRRAHERLEKGGVNGKFVLRCSEG